MFDTMNAAHLEVLAIDPATITADAAQRGERAISKAGVQTTTELLMLLAAFHQDVEDAAGAALLARFAAEFAAHESTVV